MFFELLVLRLCSFNLQQKSASLSAQCAERVLQLGCCSISLGLLVSYKNSLEISRSEGPSQCPPGIRRDEVCVFLTRGRHLSEVPQEVPNNQTESGSHSISPSGPEVPEPDGCLTWKEWRVISSVLLQLAFFYLGISLFLNIV